MSDKKFVPMFDLDRLSDQELHQYYLDACAFHGVPPELNVLAFTLMDSGDGARRRVLYAKKGATDIIRERLGISVIQIEKEIFNGTLTYTCAGKNKEGRMEIAVGASYIDGLSGRVLEIAIMVAQTRAVRRMTLQFAGAGLLDETELQADSKTADIKEALTAPQPKVRPNAAPGKDITQNPPNKGVSLQEIEAKVVADLVINSEMPTPAQLEAQAALSTVKPEVLAKEAGEVVPEAPRRRQRPKPVELDAPFSLDNPAPVTADPLAKLPNAIFHPEPPLRLDNSAFETLDKVQKQVEAVSGKNETTIKPIPELPNTEQMKGFRDRLFTYTNTILPQAGMIQTENVGGAGMKVRLFAQQKFGQVLNQLTVKQWEEMFQLFDNTKPSELVKLIDETVIKAKTA